MNIIHIGLGVRGRHWLEIVNDDPGSTSVACVDPDESALDWAKTHFPKLRNACYQRLEDALNEVKANAAIIASPPRFHASDASKALEAGLPVMVEKPLATSLFEGAQVVRLSHRTGRGIMVAQNYRYGRCEQTLRHLMQAGRVGTITHVSCIDRRERPAKGNFLSHADYSQVLDVGCHHFDSLRSILGVNPVTVTARCSKAPWSAYQHGSTTEAYVEMERNINVQYYGSLTSNGYDHSLRIEGNKGVLWTDRHRVWWRKRGGRFFIPMRLHKVPSGDALKYPREGTATLLDQFKAIAVGGRVPETNGEDNLWTLSMIHAAMLSDQTGKRVRIVNLFSQAGIDLAVSARNGQDVRA